MPPLPVQDDRIGAFTTPLGKDRLVLTRFEAREGLSTLFEQQIEAMGADSEVDPESLLGKPCSVTFKTTDRRERHFSGVVTDIQWVGQRADQFPVFQITLRPWLWLLGLTSTCRIFHHKSTPEIIREIFSGAGFSDFDFRLQQSYNPIEYCVQYQETSLNFVCRLMEEFGIYYYFEHTASKHTLVLADRPAAHKAVPGAEKLALVPRSSAEWQDREHLYHWTMERRLRSGGFVLNDYDFLQPNARLLANAVGKDGAGAKFEVYDYPGRYDKVSDGEDRARILLEAAEASDGRRHADGHAISIWAGSLITLQRHPRDSENREYLVVKSVHGYTAESYRSGGGAGGGVFNSSFELQASDRPFRAPMVTRRPLISGPQTAKVVGKDGEEIDVDKHGCVLVQFHWERDKVASRRVRVAQTSAGKTWGFQVIPRIGQEVVVEFLEGDPDRPLVTGVVYNANNTLPYMLPDNKTVTGLRSNSSRGGGGFNELRFEDKKGNEKVDFRAEKDLAVLVRNIETRDIGEDFDTADGSPSRTATLKMGDDKLVLESGSQTVDIASNQTVVAGKEITITAGSKITLTVGASKVTIEPAGITIKSININIDGMLTSLNGSAVLTANGGLVKVG